MPQQVDHRADRGKRTQQRDRDLQHIDMLELREHGAAEKYQPETQQRKQEALEAASDKAQLSAKSRFCRLTRLKPASESLPQPARQPPREANAEQQGDDLPKHVRGTQVGPWFGDGTEQRDVLHFDLP